MGADESGIENSLVGSPSPAPIRLPIRFPRNFPSPPAGAHPDHEPGVGQRNGGKGMGTGNFFHSFASIPLLNPFRGLVLKFPSARCCGKPPPHVGGYSAQRKFSYRLGSRPPLSWKIACEKLRCARGKPLGLIGALGRTRTCNLLIRSQKLYPIELRTHPNLPARTGRPTRITGRRVGSFPCFDKPRDVLVLRSRR